MAEETVLNSASDEDDKSTTKNDEESSIEDPEDRQEDENLTPIDDLKDCKNEALIEFRSRVEDAILGNHLFAETEIGNDEERIQGDTKITLWGIPFLPSEGHQGTDSILLKFLDANGFKVSEAFEMLRATLKWRREYVVDDIIGNTFSFHVFEKASISGTSKEGHPLCFSKVLPPREKELGRRLSKRRLVAEERLGEYLRWKVHLMEKCIQKLSFKPGGVDSIIQITDVKDVASRVSRKDIYWFGKKAMMVLQENYPGIIFKHIIVNVPLWFSAYNTLNLGFLTHRTKSNFIFARPSKVTETLLKFISPEHIPVQYGGLQRENDTEFSTDDKVLEQDVYTGAFARILIPAVQVGVTMVWEVTVVGYDVTYEEEFVPDDDTFYKVTLQKEKKMGECMRNSFHIREPGNIFISIGNAVHKKKKAFYRFRSKPTELVSFK